MRNSWCQIKNGKIVDGPRAWHDNTPPDNTWIPHVLVDPPHTINDKWDGQKFEIIGDQVVETNLYSPKSAEQIQQEVEALKQHAIQEVAYADKKLASENLPRREQWEQFRADWSLIVNITELSWEYKLTPRPLEF